MPRRDDTTMGGRDRWFQPTPWGEIRRACNGDESGRREALGQLLPKYWKPVYCYLRRRGCANEQAKDLVQGFFQEVILGHDFLQRADPRRGRFRSFVLTALELYAKGIHRSETAKKRSPTSGLARLDGMDVSELPQAARDLEPEQAFHHAWASALLDQVLKDLEDRCREHGLEVHWAVFRARVVRPIMEDVAPPSLKEVCEKYGVRDQTRASNMIVTVKRRFEAILKRQVRQFVDSDDEVDREIQELIGIVSRD